MKILLIDNGTDLLPKLQKLVPEEVVTKKFGDLKADDAMDFDLVVLSGGGNHNILFEHEAFNEEIAMLRSGKPIIGICFGCELIAFAFDGELIELPEEQKGIYDVEVLDESLGVGVIKVYEGHRWAVSKLPEDFSLLAKSERGPEIIKHKTLPIYGLQFHPENMVDETQGDELFIKLLSHLNYTD
jgi:GMP synthase (glutamine-hydrolysing)